MSVKVDDIEKMYIDLNDELKKDLLRIMIENSDLDSIINNILIYSKQPDAKVQFQQTKYLIYRALHANLDIEEKKILGERLTKSAQTLSEIRMMDNKFLSHKSEL